MLAPFMPSSLRLLAILCLVVSACASKGKSDAQAPGPAREREEDPLAELERYEAELSQLGVSDRDDKVATEEGSAEGAEPETKTTSAGRVEDRCPRICELADAICSLEGRICDLAAEHTDDARYVSACERAGTDCETAARACRACEGGP